MTVASSGSFATEQEAPQALQGFLTNEQWDALLVHVSGLVAEMEALPPGEPRARVFALLDGIDAIHREALRRLVRLFKEGVLEQVATDPAIHVLLELYDLLPSEPPALEAPGTPAKPPTRYRTIPINVAASKPTPGERFPHWVPVLKQRDEAASGTAQLCDVDGRTLLVCRREDQFFALEARCVSDGASLNGVTLSNYTLVCPHHAGCYYDVRNGARLGGGGKLSCFPVSVGADGRVMVGLDMDFVPHLPSF